MKAVQVHRQGGLTLVELLVSMAIFSLLGVFLFTLTSQSLEMYRRANGGAEYRDRFDSAARLLSEDLRCLYAGDPEGGGPKTRLLSSYDRRPPLIPVDASTLAPGETPPEPERVAEEYAEGDPRRFMLRFVRTWRGGEDGDTISRFAGTYAEQEAYVDGVDDGAESRAELERAAAKKRLAGERPAAIDGKVAPGLKATAGLQEVLWFIDQGPEDAPGSFTLYRAVRSPIGGEGSFFATDFDGRMNPDWVAKHASAVISGVARFGLLFWGQNTEEWEATRALDGAFLGKRAHRGGELVWDSTRSAQAGFGLHVGGASAELWEDDVFPSRAMLVLSLAPDGGEPESVLVGAVSAAQDKFSISNLGSIEETIDSGSAYLRIDEEWIAVEALQGTQLETRRGARGTIPARHDPGSSVLIPREFRKVVEMPASRSWFSGGGAGR
jgi:prepilin-type N-terminal cleavage/methylation domain-containing protein